MKKTVIAGLFLLMGMLLISACSPYEPVASDSADPQVQITKLTNAEKIIGQWDIVGESEEGESGEQLYEYYSSPKGSWVFNDNGTFTVSFASTQNCNYTVENDIYIKAYDPNTGEYKGYDLRISWQGEELILTEYFRENRNEDAPYKQDDDHDFYILRRK